MQLDLFKWADEQQRLQQIGKPCRHCLEWNNFILEDHWWDAELDYHEYRCKTKIIDDDGLDIAECGGTETIITMYRGDG